MIKLEQRWMKKLKVQLIESILYITKRENTYFTYFTSILYSNLYKDITQRTIYNL